MRVSEDLVLRFSSVGVEDSPIVGGFSMKAPNSSRFASICCGVITGASMSCNFGEDGDGEFLFEKEPMKTLFCVYRVSKKEQERKCLEGKMKKEKNGKSCCLLVPFQKGCVSSF